MNITGATFNFTKKVMEEGETLSPENPIDSDKEQKPKSAGEKTGKNKEKSNISAFAYDMLKTSAKQTISAVLSNATGSPTLQVQLQAAQQVGGKIIAYTAAVASGNWAAVATMAISDAVSYGSKVFNFEKDKAWSDYSIEQYNERRGYSLSRNRR